jgi:flagellar L-ring protein precursor FlgH
MTLDRRLIVAGLLALVLLGGQLPAGSIWAKAEGRRKMLYADDTARQVGDPITIIIEEESKIENETSRTMGKSSSRSAELSGNFDLINSIDKLTGKLFSLRSPDLNFSSEAEAEFAGDAAYDTDRSMDDRMTAIVQDILPNGQLVVIGRRERNVEGDTQVIQVSGIVRPSDITFANTISSMQMAEFHIVYRTRGRENRFTKPGWLGRFLNLINPL